MNKKESIDNWLRNDKESYFNLLNERKEDKFNNHLSATKKLNQNLVSITAGQSNRNLIILLMTAQINIIQRLAKTLQPTKLFILSQIQKPQGHSNRPVKKIGLLNFGLLFPSCYLTQIGLMSRLSNFEKYNRPVKY